MRSLVITKKIAKIKFKKFQKKKKTSVRLNELYKKNLDILSPTNLSRPTASSILIITTQIFTTDSI